MDSVRPWLRRLAVVLGVVAIVTGLLWVLSAVGPMQWRRGNSTLVLEPGRLDVALASGPVTRRPDGWVFPPGARVVLPTPHRWRPSRATATFWVGTPGAPVTTTTLAVYSVPFVFALGVSGLPAIALWWMGRRRTRVGHCAGCGYDLAGLRSGRCPECGTTVRMAWWRARAPGVSVRLAPVFG